MTNSSPLVSIIIPVFNYQNFIFETLENLLNQTYKNWEAILIDDGSTDKTAKIIKTYCFKDSRFKLIQQNNKGVSVARNLGLEIATGEFIQFLDGDDLLSQSKIEIQAQHLIENHTVDISYVDSYYFAHGNPSQL